MKAIPYRPTLIESLKDPMEAALYLDAAEKDSPEALKVALWDVAESISITNTWLEKWIIVRLLKA